MRSVNWNDYRVLLAVARTGSLNAAARRLNVDDTTVSRRLSALEAALGHPLFVRDRQNRLTPTDLGADALRRAEAIEAQADLVEEDVRGARTAPSGLVRLTAVPFIVNRVLVPRLGSLTQAHPGLQVEFVADGQNLELLARDADVAVRFARPRDGGLRIAAKRLGDICFTAFAPASAAPDAARALPWIGYAEPMGHLPQAQATRRALRRAGAREPQLLVGDLETAFAAVASGLGKAFLPTSAADRDPRFLRVPAAEEFNREVWLLTRRSHDGFRRIGAVTAWLTDIFVEPGPVPIR